MKENTHSLWAWLNQPGERKKYLNPLYSHNALVIWPSVEPQSIQLWQGELAPALAKPSFGPALGCGREWAALPFPLPTATRTPSLLGLFFRWIRSSQYLDEAWVEIRRLVEGNDPPVKESAGDRLSRSLSDPAAAPTESER